MAEKSSKTTEPEENIRTHKKIEFFKNFLLFFFLRWLRHFSSHIWLFLHLVWLFLHVQAFLGQTINKLGGLPLEGWLIIEGMGGRKKRTDRLKSPFGSNRVCHAGRGVIRKLTSGREFKRNTALGPGATIALEGGNGPDPLPFP